MRNIAKQGGLVNRELGTIRRSPETSDQCDGVDLQNHIQKSLKEEPKKVRRKIGKTTFDIVETIVFAVWQFEPLYTEEAVRNYVLEELGKHGFSEVTVKDIYMRSRGKTMQCTRLTVMISGHRSFHMVDGLL